MLVIFFLKVIQYLKVENKAQHYIVFTNDQYVQDEREKERLSHFKSNLIGTFK